MPSPSMERLDRLVRSGGSRGKEPNTHFSVDSVNVSLTGAFLFCTA